MKTYDITFNEAMKYLKRIGIPITYIARETKIPRMVLSASMNGTKNRFKKPQVLPQKHHQTIIQFVLNIQLPAILPIIRNGNLTEEEPKIKCK